MIHVFFVHSHTLFLTALGTVKYLNLNSKDVIFVFSRNYKSFIPVDFDCIDLSKEIEDAFYIMLSWSRRNFVFSSKRRNKLVAFFDSFVNNKVKSDKFILYVPHLQHHVFQVMATNPKCSKVYFIQEGGRTMLPLLTKKISCFNRLYNSLILQNDKRVWKCSNWFPSEKTPYCGEVSAYAINHSFFNNVPQNTYIVQWPSVSLNLKIDTRRPIFILEGAVELGQISRKAYVNAVQSLINEFAEQQNYIKFHPMQSTKTKEMYLNIFLKKGYEISELPMDVPFELILVNYSNLKLYGFGTSLLFYGKAFGHQVVSKEYLLKKSWRYRHYSRGLAEL